MADSELTFEKSGSRALVQFNRPQAHNAVTQRMYDQLEKVCDEIDADDEIRVAVFRGVGGKAFVAGSDIGHFQSFESGDDAIGYEDRIDQVVGRVERLGCTTIAVLEGVCAGGGVPLALACDFRYSDPGLRFGVPIAKTLGNCLSMANVARLIDYLGVTKTKEMLMLGRMLGAEQASELGLVNAVFPTHELDAEVQKLTDEILALAPLTLQAAKVAVRRTLEVRRASPESGEDFIRRCYTSDDFHEGVKAFMEKRKAQWQGR